MSKIYGHLYDLIGNTPLLRLQGYEATHGISAQIVAKLEYFNPVSYTHLDVYKRQAQVCGTICHRV